jgi:hypothetical protein
MPDTTTPPPVATEREAVLTAFKKILRTPAMPFPDPGAHSLEAYARAVHSAWCQMRFIAMDAIKGLEARSRLPAPAAPVKADHQPAEVLQHKDGHWMMSAPTANGQCWTHCAAKDEADELAEFRNRGYQYARALLSQHPVVAPSASPAQPSDEHEQGRWLRELFALIEAWRAIRDGTPSKAQAWGALWKHAHNIGPRWRARAHVASRDGALLRQVLEALKIGWVYANNTAGGVEDADTIHAAIAALTGLAQQPSGDEALMRLALEELVDCPSRVGGYGKRSKVIAALRARLEGTTK